MSAGVGFASIAGRRESNQDRLCIEKTLISGTPAILLAVADGMGGLDAGDKAAEIAIGTVGKYARDVFPNCAGSGDEIRRTIVLMFQEANRLIWAYQQESSLSGMGTTLVFCLVMPGRYLVANAGDSRCYYINNGEAHQVTEDHSRVQELVRKGGMTPEAAKRSPYRNQLTNCLGDEHEIRVDIFPQAGRYGIIDEDCVLLLSSDGLHSDVPDDLLLRQLRRSGNLESGCADLATLAFQRGSTDNITVAAVECGSLRRECAEPAPPEEKNPASSPAPVKPRLMVRRRRLVTGALSALLALLAAASYLVSRFLRP